jgi:polysaccharide biosynthesis transport protein
MADAFEPFRYIRYIGGRWRFVAASCSLAVGLAAAASATLPRRYTATARIVIDAPAIADPRTVLALIPTYLETYQEFAASDSLFRKAVDRFGLRTLVGASSIESIKSSVLKVGIVRNSRVLEIAATLPSPAKSQALAQFLAEQVVALNQSLNVQSGHDMVTVVERQQREAQAQLDRANREWSQVSSNEPIDELEAGIEEATKLRLMLREEMARARLDLADAAGREKEAAGDDKGELREQQSTAQARFDELGKQLAALDSEAARKESLVASRSAKRERLKAELDAAQKSLAAAEAQLRDARNEAGTHGERMTIIDPGAVPEQPSSPNIPLNLSAALLLGLLLPLVYLAVELNFRPQRAASHRAGLKAVALARDE